MKDIYIKLPAFHPVNMFALTIVHKRCDHLCLWPLRLCVEFLRQPIPSALIRNRDLCEVVVQNGLMEVYDELYSTTCKAISRGPPRGK